MNPNVFLYKESEKNYVLYFGNYSTLESLALIDANIKIEITCFIATDIQDTVWISEKELPLLSTVGEVRTFLLGKDDIYSIINFEADFADIGSVSTHDDGECQFSFFNKKTCLDILKMITPSQFSDLIIKELLNNPDSYITCSANGEIVKYRSFDEYLTDIGIL